jgi:hypothetical protein
MKDEPDNRHGLIIVRRIDSEHTVVKWLRVGFVPHDGQVVVWQGPDGMHERVKLDGVKWDADAEAWVEWAWDRTIIDSEYARERDLRYNASLWNRWGWWWRGKLGIFTHGPGWVCEVPSADEAAGWYVARGWKLLPKGCDWRSTLLETLDCAQRGTPVADG